MAVTITKVYGPVSIGDRWQTVNKVDFDSSYPTGGESLTRVNLGFSANTDPEFNVTTDPSLGYIARYDHTNQKLKIYSNIATYTATYDPASLAAVTARDDSVTVTGVLAGDIIVGWKPAAALTSGLSIQGVRVSADNTVIVRLNNASAGAIDGASGTWTFYVAAANGAAKEIQDTTDLSALLGVRVVATGKFV